VVSSPTPQAAGHSMMLNLNQIHNNNNQQDSISNNPYILSPNNHRYNDSINSAKPNLPHPTFQLSQKPPPSQNLSSYQSL
jgi:hypothetical protein